VDSIEAVEAFVRLSHERPDADEDELVQALIAHGFSEDEAERALAFVPMAFGRVLLAPSIPVFPDTYEIRDPDSDRRARGQLSSEPVYLAAYEYAQAYDGDEDVLRIGAGSAEMRTANQLVAEGSEIGDVRFTETILLRIQIPES
jgi:hypothetical protein